MFNKSRRHRFVYVILAIALIILGAAFILDSRTALAADPPVLSLQLELDCSICHTDFPIQTVGTAHFSPDPCDACHDEAPKEDRIISPGELGRDLANLESSFAIFGRWDNPLQRNDTRYRVAMDQMWQAKYLIGAADETGELLEVQSLIIDSGAALAQLEAEAKWGFWESLDSPELPSDAIMSRVPSPIPLDGHILGDRLAYLVPPSEYGPTLDLAGLLVLSLCVLLVALRRAPPSEHHNIFLNTFSHFTRRASGNDRSPFLFANFLFNPSYCSMRSTEHTPTSFVVVSWFWGCHLPSQNEYQGGVARHNNSPTRHYKDLNKKGKK